MQHPHITIDLLKNHPNHIPALAQLWEQGIGEPWLPGTPVDRVIENYTNHMNDQNLPLTFIALNDDKLVGMCSLRANDGIRPDLTPWLGSLVVDRAHQKQGIAKILMNKIKHKAKEMGYDRLHLFAFDPTIPTYYASLGWTQIAMDEYRGHKVVVMDLGL
jgi:GNAT superfamily N-acetyltransferase